MKKRTGAILAVVAFVVGLWTGHFVSSYFWSRVVEEGTVSHCLYDVSSVYFPLKFLKDGQAEKATQYLQTEMHGALSGVDLMSTTLHRPDVLTNSDVVSARALDRN
jgi:hypothetical protein